MDVGAVLRVVRAAFGTAPRAPLRPGSHAFEKQPCLLLGRTRFSGVFWQRLPGFPSSGLGHTEGSGRDSEMGYDLLLHEKGLDRCACCTRRLAVGEEQGLECLQCPGLHPGDILTTNRSVTPLVPGL